MQPSNLNFKVQFWFKLIYKLFSTPLMFCGNSLNLVIWLIEYICVIFFITFIDIDLILISWWIMVIVTAKILLLQLPANHPATVGIKTWLRMVILQMNRLILFPLSPSPLSPQGPLLWWPLLLRCWTDG